MGFAVLNTKGKDGDWKSEWIVVESEWGQDCFITREEKSVRTQFVGESNWKKRGDVSLLEESRRILQRIKDKYTPFTNYFVQLFCYSWFLARAYSFAQSCQSLVSCACYQASDPFQTATKLTLPRPLRVIKVKKEEGLKQRSVPVGIPRLLIPPAHSTKPSVLELEARLGRDQGKVGVPTSLSPARVSYSTSSKTASAFGSIRSASTALDKGKGVLKALKVPASMEREPPVLSEEEVVEAFRCIYPRGRLSSLSLTPALEGFKCFLALEHLVVSFHEELRVSERRRADAKAQLKQAELAFVNLSAEKWGAEETQATMAGQVVHWKHDLEK
ncbi:hypothetical protein QYF36_010241 [Acer negundo]|nr:hypothetical protein QYF36_010241 [Acer negundo]